MHTSLSAQLAQLELGHLAVERSGDRPALDAPETDAVVQTLAAIWSDLFALFPGTSIEEDIEEIAWGMVSLFHRAAAKRSAQLDRATDEIRCLLASADGSEVHTHDLERQVERDFGPAMIFMLIGFIMAIAVFIFTVLPGTKGPNRFGPDPYDPSNLEEVFA